MSQFINNSQSGFLSDSSDIDFSLARQLPGGGSTCDIYLTRHQHRLVFIKRLKEQFRNNPVNLDALDKEFEIGVGLHHPSLPEYLEFHRHYIVMNYIDGSTLADMIARRDPWLENQQNVIKMLKQLVEVVDYLHRHNTVHCDIKPDNIMITANNKNLVLIDFDKGYTDALSFTSGHPGKYGLPAEYKGKAEIDFHGISLVAEQLRSIKCEGLDRFIKACNQPGADCHKLIALLDRLAHRRKKLILRSAIFIGIALASFIAYELYRLEKTTAPPVIRATTQPQAEAMVEPSAPVASDSITSTTPPPRPLTANDGVTPAPVSLDSLPFATSVDNYKIKAAAARLDEQVKPLYDELYVRLDKLLDLLNDTTLTTSDLISHSNSFHSVANEYLEQTYDLARQLADELSLQSGSEPDNLLPHIIIANSKQYYNYANRASTDMIKFTKQAISRQNL